MKIAQFSRDERSQVREIGEIKFLQHQMHAGPGPHPTGKSVNALRLEDRFFGNFANFSAIVIRYLRFFRSPANQRTETRNPPASIDLLIENSRRQRCS